MARLRSEAMTRGAFPVLTRELSSWQLTSRTQWSLFSMCQCPWILLQAGPFLLGSAACAS
jgi:hypothetical protein